MVKRNKTNQEYVKAEFKFTYLSESEFSQILKKVQRERRQKQEQREWELYLQAKKLKESENQVKSPSWFGNRLYTIQIGESEVHRLEEMRCRLMTHLEAISVLVKGKVVAESDEDMLRLQKRAVEFIARFTRNYLYQIKRQLKEVKMKMVNPADAIRYGKGPAIFNKILSVYQTIMQGLQTLEKNVPACFVDGVPNPVVDFMNCLAELTKLTSKAFYYDSDIDELEVHCKRILNSLEETRKSPKAAPKKKATAQSKKQGEKKRDNLWMYETAMKPQWKKKSAALAKAKFGPPPKKSVLSKQAKPLPPIETSQPLSSKRDEPKSHTTNDSFKVLKHLAVVENWRHPTRGVAEDQVRTMMEIIPPYTPNIDDGTEDMVVKAPSVETSKQSLENFIKNGELIKYKEICDFLNVAVDELKGIMKQIKEISNFKFLQNLQSQDPVELPVTLRTQKNNIKSPNNVKLFHVVEDENLSNEPGFKKEVRGDIVLHMSEQDCRTARSFKEAFLEYKKSSSHYNCPNGEKPWHIVERISEMIIDQVTKDVAQELEAEILMKQIIELEFKE